MKFRTVFLMNRVIAPAGVAIFALSFFVDHDLARNTLRVVGGVPLLLAGLYGALRGFQMERHHFLPMLCPFCEQEGIAGCGVGPVGWWLRCETCGIVEPKGLLGLSYTKRQVDEEEEDDSEG